MMARVQTTGGIKPLISPEFWCLRDFADYYRNEHLQLVQKCISTKQRQVLLFPLLEEPGVLCCAIAEYDEYDDTIVYQQYLYCDWYDDFDEFIDELANNSYPDTCIRIYGYNARL